MVREIRLYVEGGGDNKGTKRPLREGFSKFFEELIKEGKRRRIKIGIVLCGNGEATFEKFMIALKLNPEVESFLLVDADDPVSTDRLDHVGIHHGWAVAGVAEAQCHLMVQVMESWFLADPDALEEFYGEKFQRGSLPSHHDIEVHDKLRVIESLKHAIRNCRKPNYDKIHHAAEILKRLRPSKVRTSSKHCNHLFQTLEAVIKS